MSANGWLQILLYSLVILAVTKLLGIYMFRVFEGNQQPLPRFFGPIEHGRTGCVGWTPGNNRRGKTTPWRCSSLAPSAFLSHTLYSGCNISCP